MSRLKISSYYADRPGDSLWTRAKNRLTRRRVPGFPRTLQIQTFTGCNADCIFCPYGATHGSQPRGKMPDELFRRIIDEAARHRVRRISPYLMNEPLMDRNLCDKIRYINARIPACKVVLTSNGHFLTPQTAERILDLGKGLHEIYLSFQGIDPAAYATTMGGNMDFDRTLANVNHFLEARRRRGADRPRLWITMVDTALVDARKAVAYWRARGVPSKYTTLENLGGNIPDASLYSRTKALSPNTTCTRLFKQAYIMFNGDMVLCCVDYSRRQVLGNILETSIHEVWNGDVARGIRRRYLDREFAALPLCGSCRIDDAREVRVRESGRQTIRGAAGETR